MLGMDGPITVCLSVCDRHVLPVLRFVQDESPLCDVEPPIVIKLDEFWRVAEETGLTLGTLTESRRVS
jgi:hypothetical protein